MMSSHVTVSCIIINLCKVYTKRLNLCISTCSRVLNQGPMLFSIVVYKNKINMSTTKIRYCDISTFVDIDVTFGFPHYNARIIKQVVPTIKITFYILHKTFHCLHCMYNVQTEDVDLTLPVFCQLRKWPPARMSGCVYRPVRPVVLIYG